MDFVDELISHMHVLHTHKNSSQKTSPWIVDESISHIHVLHTHEKKKTGGYVSGTVRGVGMLLESGGSESG